MLLVRGGMNVTFAGKGLIVVIMTFLPLILEAITVSLIGKRLFEMPIEVAFSLGFVLSSVAPSIVIPPLIRWNDLGYGRSKGIPGLLIASCTFDNITSIILFGVCKTIAFEYAALEKGTTSKNKNIAWSIGSVFVHNIAGIIAGVIMGLIGWLFKFIETKSYCMKLKCAFAILTAIGLVIASELSTFKNAKFIACLSFGYTCFRVWGQNKPAKEMADLWFYI